MRISAGPGTLELTPELLQIHSMLGRFLLADENNGNIPTVALPQNRIGIYIHFVQDRAELSQERGDGGLGFVAEVASGTSIESNVAGTAGGKPGVFGMRTHRFIAKLHLTGEQAPVGRTGA